MTHRRSRSQCAIATRRRTSGAWCGCWSVARRFSNTSRARWPSLNGEPGRPDSFDALAALLEAQAYRLSYWRVAVDEINYRRFFDVNDLAALRMDERDVFEAAHALIFELIEQGAIDGLRIDHSDGLYDPERYFARLQQRFGAAAEEPRPLYVVTEKILAAHERLPETWLVYGTTGYDFAALSTTWLVCGDGEDSHDAALPAVHGKRCVVR